jgi:hypothetical protein
MASKRGRYNWAYLKELLLFRFFLKLLFGTIIFDNFGENHSKYIHHFTSASTFQITTVSIQSACFHNRNEKDLSEAYLHLSLFSLQNFYCDKVFSDLLTFPKYKLFYNFDVHVSSLFILHPIHT